MVLNSSYILHIYQFFREDGFSCISSGGKILQITLTRMLTVWKNGRYGTEALASGPYKGRIGLNNALS